MTATATPPVPKLATVKGVEIFQAGEHREGKAYTVADLDQMVDNFAELQEVLKPPVVVGHEEDQSFLENSGYPSAGGVVRVWREADTLYADFAEVPETIARLINGRAYRAVSAEVYDDFEHQGKRYGKTLRRVALLGGELPQIKTLADLPLADYSERPRRADLTPGRTIRHDATNSYLCFSKVKPMATVTTPAKKRQKLQKFSDRCKAAFKKFADEPAMPDQAAPPPAGVSRDDMVAMLVEYGFDPAVLEKIPDEGLAEIIRVYKSGMQAMADPAAPQPGTVNAEPPATPPVAPAPAPAPAASSIPGVPNATPSQVTLKFGEKDVKLEEVLAPVVNAAVAAAIKPIQDKLSAAEQSVDKFQETQRRAVIDAKWSEWLKAGKVIPAQEPAIKKRLNRANAVQKFADGKTELDVQLEEIDAYPCVLKFAEQVKTGKGGAAGSADAEVQKVQAFSESAEFTPVLRASGKSSQQYVAEFKAAQAKKPELTARQYGVPEPYTA